MSLLGFELLFRFLWGSLFVLMFVSRRESSERFLRIALYTALGVGFCAAALAAQNPLIRWTGLASLGLLLCGFAAYTFIVARPGRILGFALLLMAPLPALVRAPLTDAINFLTSSLILGGVFGGQFVGHWYLTVANLHIREFQRVIKFLWLGLTLKTVELSGTLWSAYLSTRFMGMDSLGRPEPIGMNHGQNIADAISGSSLLGIRGEVFLGLGTFGLLILLSRLLWGIVAPWILTVLVQRTVDQRATQSATGILYALCVMIILGEGAGLFLKLTLGWNI